MSPLVAWIRSCTLLLIAVGACTERAPPEASVALPRFEILRELEQVRLGMRVLELQRVRPQIVTTARSGARETIGRDTVWYFFDRPSDREPQPGRDQLKQLSRSRVVGVAVTRLASSEASADSLVLEWVSRLGVPGECLLHHYRDVTNEVAVFEERGRSVYITKRPPGRVAHAGGALQLAGGVQLLIAAPESRAVPQAPHIERVDCALLFASAREQRTMPGDSASPD
ncbi:hypothetical protein BH23GEM2_BH23GEM2_23190 [soil metagenome]